MMKKISALVLAGVVLMPGLSRATTSPIGLWHFDETSGSTAADSSGNGRTITLSGTYTHSSGHLNNGTTFNGSTGYGSVNWSILTGSAARSVSLWFKTSTTSNATFVSWGGSADGTLSKVGIQSGQIGFFGSANNLSTSCSTAVTTGNYANGQWHHLAVSFNQLLVTTELYIDGVRIIARSNSPNTSSSQLFVGRSVNGGDFLNGSLDEVAIYDRNISAQEVATISGLGSYALKTVTVLSPAYCSDISATTTVSIVAPGFTSATAKCWQSGGTYGADSTVSSITLSGANGAGSFSFNPASYPHGPIIIRITGTDGTVSDTCYLQLYNTVGAAWNEGIPSTAPAAAAGLSLIYADDFKSLPGIVRNSTYRTATTSYYSYGNFSTIPFADATSTTSNPFSQRDTYLRIRANSDPAVFSTGLLTSVFKTPYPVYMECRFIAQDAPGSWPAFWSCTDGSTTAGYVDEEDIVEAYGGDGAGSPGGTLNNSWTNYRVTSHEWTPSGQNPNYTTTNSYHISAGIDMSTIGGHAGWSYTPHTYGMLVTTTTTSYYLDNVLVGSKLTTPVSLTDNFNLIMNLGAGGGWPVDFQRYGGLADMYIDYVRVYGLPLGTEVPLTDQDIGTVAFAGNASYSGGVFTVSGAGGAYIGSADGFNYAYQAVTGDCVITARTTSLTGPNAEAKAGVMIRNDLTPGSTFVSVGGTYNSGTEYLYRTTAGGSAVGVHVTAGSWVRVTRVGNVLTAYTSTDGVTYTLVGSQTITLGSTVYIGLAVTSRDNLELSTATFDNVSGGSNY